MTTHQFFRAIAMMNTLSALPIDWEKLKTTHAYLLEELVQPTLETKRRAELQKKASMIGRVLEAYQTISQLEAEHTAAKKELENAQGELAALYQEELVDLEQRTKEAYQALEDFLYPADEHDDRSVFLEIRAGTGGAEAALFAADLCGMYRSYAEQRGWQASIVEATDTDLGGYKELIMHVKGKGAYKHLKFESGVHRVQRVPKTESAGRVHTSTVTVAVLPELEDVEVTISPSDLRIDTYRSSGAGGQHVNTTDSAIRITHIPTGLVVTCQDERSQIKNKAKALKILQARLFEQERQKRESAMSSARMQQIGSGERAEKIRTYNFPQNRVTDHRVDVTLKKLDMVMQGDLDDLIDPLIAWELEERRAKGLNIDLA